MEQSFSPVQSSPFLISIVIPIYNEAVQLAYNIQVISSYLTGYNTEFILVDDGSSDNSVQIISDLNQQQPSIKGVFLTRNFGKEAAIHAGLEAAIGDAVIVMDVDLQHPPTLLKHMIERWQQGQVVVEAVKAFRNDGSTLDRLFAGGFYMLYHKFSGLDIANYSDFKLLDRKVVDIYLSLPERQRFFRGLVNWLGIQCDTLEFDVAERSGVGRSWTRFRLLKYAINNITSFSTIPLQIITVFGVIVVIFGSMLGVLTLGQKLMGVSVEGFTCPSGEPA